MFITLFFLFKIFAKNNICNKHFPIHKILKNITIRENKIQTMHLLKKSILLDVKGKILAPVESYIYL